MGRLTTNELRGIWAGITLPWDEHDHLDEAAYQADIERMCQAGVHGIYTTGSTGEFYALDFDEFTRMVDIQDALCGQYRMPLQIGCCADCTRKTLRLVEYAAAKAQVGAVQITLPYWMELSDREILRFFQDIAAVCPEMPIIHYNVPRAKRFLQGPDYLRILDVTPSLAGVKYTYAGTNFGNLQQALLLTPQLAYFVGENLLVSAMMLGARGSCSSVISTNPPFMLKMYALAEQGHWDEALRMQQTVARFFMDMDAFIEETGVESMDPVADKAVAVAAGCSMGHQRTRAPYIGWPDKAVAGFRTLLETRYPQLIYGAPI